MVEHSFCLILKVCCRKYRYIRNQSLFNPFSSLSPKKHRYVSFTIFCITFRHAAVPLHAFKYLLLSTLLLKAVVLREESRLQFFLLGPCCWEEEIATKSCTMLSHEVKKEKMEEVRPRDLRGSFIPFSFFLFL